MYFAICCSVSPQVEATLLLGAMHGLVFFPVVLSLCPPTGAGGAHVARGKEASTTKAAGLEGGG